MWNQNIVSIVAIKRILHKICWLMSRVGGYPSTLHYFKSFLKLKIISFRFHLKWYHFVMPNRHAFLEKKKYSRICEATYILISWFEYITSSIFIYRASYSSFWGELCLYSIGCLFVFLFAKVLFSQNDHRVWWLANNAWEIVWYGKNQLMNDHGRELVLGNFKLFDIFLSWFALFMHLIIWKKKKSSYHSKKKEKENSSSTMFLLLIVVIWMFKVSTSFKNS